MPAPVCLQGGSDSEEPPRVRVLTEEEAFGAYTLAHLKLLRVFSPKHHSLQDTLPPEALCGGVPCATHCAQHYMQQDERQALQQGVDVLQRTGVLGNPEALRELVNQLAQPFLHEIVMDEHLSDIFHKLLPQAIELYKDTDIKQVILPVSLASVLVIRQPLW
jgi:hypothetical protein